MVDVERNGVGRGYQRRQNYVSLNYSGLGDIREHSRGGERVMAMKEQIRHAMSWAEHEQLLNSLHKNFQYALSEEENIEGMRVGLNGR